MYCRVSVLISFLPSSCPIWGRVSSIKQALLSLLSYIYYFWLLSQFSIADSYIGLVESQLNQPRINTR